MPLLSQRHSTTPPTPKRYDNRYEEEFQKLPIQISDDEDVMVGSEDEKVGLIYSSESTLGTLGH